jgi:thiamine transporter ThiT
MDWYNVTLFISLFVVVAILAWGLITMARGGEYNKSKSNLIMRYRIVFQAIAILVFVCLLLYKRYTNG